MRLHPLLRRPEVVVVSRTAVSPKPTAAEYRSAGRAILEAIGLEIAGERVVLKPNLTTAEQRADPDDGISTHPAFLRGLVDHLRAHGARRGRLYVLEDPLDEDHDRPRDWDRTGLPQALDGTGVKLRFPTASTVVRRRVPGPLVHAERRVSRLAVEDGTVLVNVPKLKTHGIAITTVCVKNLMGVDYVADRHYCGQAIRAALPRAAQQGGPDFAAWATFDDHEKVQLELAKRLVDLVKVVRPALNVVEGVVGRDGTGFHRGRNFPLGVSLAGTCAVTVDAFASWLMGFDPLKLIYLQLAAAAGLGEIDPRKIEVYTVEIGGLVRCRDASGLRFRPAFDAITQSREQDYDRYR